MRSQPALPLLALGSVLMLLAGCGEVDEADDPESAEEAPSEDDDELEPGDDEPSDEDDGDLDAEIQTAVEDAATSADVDPDDVEVVVAEHVTWSDGSLGCPQPDEGYTQALVEGYRIELEVAGETVVYHGADGDGPFRCDDPQEPAETGDAVS
ncbi:MAG: hypothetical protein ACLFRD_03265 [Nitriliruptoraceae bacterium]